MNHKDTARVLVGLGLLMWMMGLIFVVSVVTWWSIGLWVVGIILYAIGSRWERRIKKIEEIGIVKTYRG